MHAQVGRKKYHDMINSCKAIRQTRVEGDRLTLKSLRVKMKQKRKLR